MTEHTHHHDEDAACEVAHSPVTPATAAAGAGAGGAAGERTLIAVFASPVAGYLLRYGADMGFRGLLLEPDEARAAGAAALGFPLLTAVPDDLDDSADVVVTDHHRPELGVMLRDALATKARWVGIMGNPHHVGPHVAMLTELGVPADEIARVHRPIGLNIGSRIPPEIAVSTLAGLLADRNGRPGGFDFLPRKNPPGGAYPPAFMDAFHGGLLGDRSVQRVVEAFLTSGTVPDQNLDEMAGGSQRDLRGAAQVIAAAAAAWRMPDLRPACPG